MSHISSGNRLHPSSPFFLIIELIKSFFVPLLVALFAGGGDRYELIGAVFVIPSTIAVLLQYSVYRYQLLDHEIVIREGVFVKNIRHVQYQRIQNLNLIRNPLHRLLGVAQLELESASGGKPEAVMRVLSLSAVEAIREKVMHAKAGVQRKNASTQSDATLRNAEDSKGESAREILSLPLSELIKAGIISNKGILVVAFFFGILAQTRATEAFFNTLEAHLEPWLNAINLDFSQPVTIVLMVILGLVGFFVVIRMLSILYMVITFYRFRLIEADDKLQVSYGLLTQFNATVPRQRIQQLSITQNLFHRLFERVAVRIATAGGSAQQGHDRQSFKWIAPILPVQQCETFVTDIQPSLSQEVQQWHAVPFRAWRRVTRFYTLLLLMIMMALYPLIGWQVVWLLLFIPVIVVYARKLVASMRYGFSSNGLIYQRGWIVQHRTLVPINKIQSVNFYQSPFDRRNHMARVSIDVAGVDVTQPSIAIRYLDVDVAQSLLDDLYQKVSATEYRWK
jgi:putative membrane protein